MNIPKTPEITLIIKHNKYFHFMFNEVEYTAIIKTVGYNYANVRVYTYKPTLICYTKLTNFTDSDSFHKKNVYDITRIKSLCVDAVIKKLFELTYKHATHI